jgi:hypothetical protein
MTDNSLASLRENIVKRRRQKTNKESCRSGKLCLNIKE